MLEQEAKPIYRLRMQCAFCRSTSPQN